MEKEIYKSQINSINSAKKYLKKCYYDGVDVTMSPFCDFVLWADCIGNEKIKSLSNQKILSLNLIINYLKEFLSILKNSNYIKNNSINIKKKKINIIYSYCSKDNFNSKGEFYDRYFNIGSKKEGNIFWFLISLDNYVPKMTNNVFIIHKKNSSLNFSVFFKLILKNLFKKNIIHNFNNTIFFSNKFANFFYETFKNCNFNLYIPYENRPHQNAVIKMAKKISKKNKVYGYYHRMPEPLQLEMIYKLKYLDKLYVCSKIQKKVFEKYFSWPLKKIKIINSLRYVSFKKRKKIVFLPYNIEDKNFFLDKIKLLLELKKVSIKGFKVSIHYLNKENKNHLNLKEKILKINLIKRKKILDAPVILGEPGSVAAEMLDTVGKVYHVSNRNLNIFSENIWKNIKVVKISDSLYEYTKIKKENFLNVNGKKNNFIKLLKKNKFLN